VGLTVRVVSVGRESVQVRVYSMHRMLPAPATVQSTNLVTGDQDAPRGLPVRRGRSPELTTSGCLVHKSPLGGETP
jgi:hypothetical protein